MAKTGVQGAATGSLITLLNGPPLTGTVATPPAAPGGFTATAVSSSQINLQWNASAGATEYVIYQWNYTTQKVESDRHHHEPELSGHEAGHWHGVPL